jgi:hypothetical protein
MCSTFWLESLKGRYRLEDLGTDERVILKRILGKLGWGCGLNSSGSGQGQVAGSYEHSNEPSDSIKCREFLD